MIVVLIITVVLVGICVGIHYESMVMIIKLSNRWDHLRRGGIVIAVLGSLAAHVIEISVFAFAYRIMIPVGRFGALIMDDTPVLQDCFYFSFVTYTTLGFGDITPVGPIRFLTAAEALAGLVLITWSASFLFILMQRHWAIETPSSGTD